MDASFSSETLIQNNLESRYRYAETVLLTYKNSVGMDGRSIFTSAACCLYYANIIREVSQIATGCLLTLRPIHRIVPHSEEDTGDKSLSTSSIRDVASPGAITDDPEKTRTRTA